MIFEIVGARIIAPLLYGELTQRRARHDRRQKGNA